MTPHIIVIGASAGGFEALQTLVAALPQSLPASIFVVWHMATEVRGVLPHVLNKYDTLPASSAVDGERIEAGRIYVAPPDRHMLLEGDHIRLSRGPKENRFRPAVDPLFRSAAFAHGGRVIGIILSGALDDGTSGLWAIKQRGGIAIVQEPRDAAVSSMPESALREVDVDYTVPVADMAPLLERLCANAPAQSRHIPEPAMEDNQRTEAELRAATNESFGPSDFVEYGDPSPYSCPECHGVLAAIKEGGRFRFRCHTGHAYSTDSLLASLSENVDDSLWNAMRGIEESMMLLNHLGDHCAERNQPSLAAKYFKKASEAGLRLEVVKSIVTTNEALSNERIAEDIESGGQD